MEAFTEIHGILQCRWSESFHCPPPLHFPRIFSVEAFMSFRTPLHPSIYFHKNHTLRVASKPLPQWSTGFRWIHCHGSIHQLLYKLPWKSIEDYLVSRTFPWELVEVDLIPWKSMEGSMEVHGRIHWRWKYNLPLPPSIPASTIYSVEASINSHIPLHQSIPTTITNYQLLPQH